MPQAAAVWLMVQAPRNVNFPDYLEAALSYVCTAWLWRLASIPASLALLFPFAIHPPTPLHPLLPLQSHLQLAPLAPPAPLLHFPLLDPPVRFSQHVANNQFAHY